MESHPSLPICLNLSPVTGMLASISTRQGWPKRESKLWRCGPYILTRNVLTEIGSFGGLFRLDRNKLSQPVLVSSVDGVGTKLKVAFATGKLAPEVVAKVVEGIANGCREAGCALVAGETAEMPGFYRDGEYDLAGFIVGIVDKARIIDGSAICPGDVILGLPSAGLHTNGYSLARRLLLEQAGYTTNTPIPELRQTVRTALLAPHLSYLRILRSLVHRKLIRGMAHITGGGFTENIPRVLPTNCEASVRARSWPTLPIFRWLQKLGRIDDLEMLRTFNMGIGMVIIVSQSDSSKVQRHFKVQKQAFHSIGVIRRGKSRVVCDR